MPSIQFCFFFPYVWHDSYTISAWPLLWQTTGQAEIFFGKKTDGMPSVWCLLLFSQVWLYSWHAICSVFLCYFHMFDMTHTSFLQDLQFDKLQVKQNFFWKQTARKASWNKVHGIRWVSNPSTSIDPRSINIGFSGTNPKYPFCSR